MANGGKLAKLQTFIKKIKMAKGGKLTKLKSILKKIMQTFKFGRFNCGPIAAADNNSDVDSLTDSVIIRAGFCPVYVGKSRRRYLVTPETMENPLFKELLDRTDDDWITVGNEFILFEHLLWMLENADPQPKTLEELVEFYAC